MSQWNTSQSHLVNDVVKRNDAAHNSQQGDPRRKWFGHKSRTARWPTTTYSWRAFPFHHCLNDGRPNTTTPTAANVIGGKHLCHNTDPISATDVDSDDDATNCIPSNVAIRPTSSGANCNTQMPPPFDSMTHGQPPILQTTLPLNQTTDTQPLFHAPLINQAPVGT